MAPYGYYYRAMERNFRSDRNSIYFEHYFQKGKRGSTTDNAGAMEWWYSRNSNTVHLIAKDCPWLEEKHGQTGWRLCRTILKVVRALEIFRLVKLERYKNHLLQKTFFLYSYIVVFLVSFHNSCWTLWHSFVSPL